MTRTLLCLLLAAALGLTCLVSCDISEFAATIVVAQVARTLSPESNTATVLIGNAEIVNLLNNQREWMRLPSPLDTAFVNPFPGQIEPVTGATCLVNSDTLGPKLPGVYFRAALGLQPRQRYDLAITMPDGNTVTAYGFLPSDFTITQPVTGDTVLDDWTLAVAWTRADSAQTYLVGINPTDTLSPAQGWSDSRTDTSCLVPATAFRDSLGNYVPGEYLLGVTAVNGGWQGSGLDLFLSGGNLNGAKGVFGCAVYARPLLIYAR